MTSTKTAAPPQPARTTAAADLPTPGPADGLTGPTWEPAPPGPRRPAGDHSGAEASTSLRHSRLREPLHWQEPGHLLVARRFDLFWADVPDTWIAQVWAVMALVSQHMFRLLTPSSERARSLLSSPSFWHLVAEEGDRHIGSAQGWLRVRAILGGSPLPNVWLGVPASDQHQAGARVPPLLATPAAVRFVSAEPLLGPISMPGLFQYRPGPGLPYNLEPRLDWVTCGGEVGAAARPVHPAWVRSLRDQCVKAEVAFRFTGWGGWRWVREGCDRAYEREHGDQFSGVPWESLTLAGTIRADNRLVAATDTIVQRVGTRRAGCELDGEVWDELPLGPGGKAAGV